MVDPLREELRALARDLQRHDISLIVGGGYGLVLRAEMMAESGSRTLIPDLPGARSTEDLDIFLKAEVISNSAKTGPIREALDRRGYEPVVKHFQFEREVDYMSRTRKVKVDLFRPGGPLPNFRASMIHRGKGRLGYGAINPSSPESLGPWIDEKRSI